MTEKEEQFYKDKSWEMLFKRLDAIDTKNEAMSKEITAIKEQTAGKFGKIYGVAIGISFISGLVGAYIKSKLPQ